MATTVEKVDTVDHPVDGLQPEDVAAWRQRWQEGNTPWNLGQPAPDLVKVLSNWPAAGRALVPGCGHGHEVSLLQDLGWDTVGLDVAPEALAAARQRDPRPQWHCGDLLTPPPAWLETFDLVLEHTCFCAVLPRYRHAYCQAVTSLLKPGGDVSGAVLVP